MGYIETRSDHSQEMTVTRVDVEESSGNGSKSHQMHVDW